MVVAGLFSGWLHRVRRQGLAVTAAICVWGTGVALFGLTRSLWLAVLFLAIAGAGDLVSSVYRSSMLQTVATDDMRGRMQGVFIVVVAGGPRLADLWHGPAAAGFGPGPAATAGGIAVVVVALAVVARYPDFWRYRAPTG
jgi:MFS-type transporter involved in bile tolerance (Atg22 family)